jgi:hypothetical protein
MRRQNRMDDQKRPIKIVDKTLAVWLTGILLLMLLCVAAPAIFPGLSWMYLLFPAGVVAGPAALMIFAHRLNHGKPPHGDNEIPECKK